MIVLGLSDAPLVAQLLAHAGPEQQVLDLVGLKDRGALKAAYQGICW
ncbi:hypothetical protein [Ectothiorhodospira sp. PHS-1]|nr:hypothetical protein [Ectothiorhodospira sp. PHS-1]